MSDGLDGLEALINIAGAVMLLGGVGACALAGRLVADAVGWSGSRRLAAMSIGGIVGLGLGTCLTMATFMETTWRPPPLIRSAVPDRFRHDWVILLQDRVRGRLTRCRGHELPFTAFPPRSLFRQEELCAGVIWVA